jgi:hypothetical protein
MGPSPHYSCFPPFLTVTVLHRDMHLNRLALLLSLPRCVQMRAETDVVQEY